MAAGRTAVGITARVDIMGAAATMAAPTMADPISAWDGHIIIRIPTPMRTAPAPAGIMMLTDIGIRRLATRRLITGTKPRYGRGSEGRSRGADFRVK
jgi:hypothetical protein